ncbi:MAG: 1-acyl-sn-glycerol-3-phosphate acyltransferase [Planctomycetes bacterium]|nr:1-acyl-sn-glycerol-3-phosphate acyltransferase [Planctomycetota bacterium]MCB9912986.1 1-acyl-sn-glycerol-3-phosphate acyltransferase [Planctomycetota bacterium]HPF13168.1 1-acyl-sn-glycerol-3-phosphate acyltransferase [Planctomycetota bacterium]HRV82123.1 1-acyl-sn-glycerol-3-phosphate acyltransferase [Planctomycetota bacterium]
MSLISTLRAAIRIPLLALATLIPLPIMFVGRAVGFLGARRVSSKICHFAIRGWARSCLAIMGVDLRVAGEAPAPPFFLVSNHLSYLDIVVLHATCRARFLSKLEIAHWPVAGWLARLAGTLFIDRTQRRDVARAIPELRDALAAGDGVIIFPEGTSSAGSLVLPFHASLLQVPISLDMPTHWASLAYKTPEGSQPAFWSVCWWGDMPFASHFLKLLTLPRIQADLDFGAPPVEAGDRKALAAALHGAVTSRFRPSAPPHVAESPAHDPHTASL